MREHGLELSKGRFESFSDGIFAFAITLLVLEIHLPDRIGAQTPNGEQARALLALWPQYLVYFTSFATIGIMWINHHALFRYIERITWQMVMSNLGLLMLIVFLPFPNEVLARLGLTPVATAYYGLTVTLISIAYFGVYRAVAAQHREVAAPITMWSIVGLTFYPLATLVGWFVPVLGIALMVALAFWYMLPSNISRAVIKPKL
ncbi:MAG: DUF1211 domain-containing protein [Candidatus Eremiobacteraeota bacterium]|nr:DUF1211 domain-containing protein [Candidatus Eremiobacteraeota bacterium]